MLEDLTSFYAGRLAYPMTLSTGKILTGPTFLPPSASIEFVLSCLGGDMADYEAFIYKASGVRKPPQVYSVCVLTAWTQYCDNVQYS